MPDLKALVAEGERLYNTSVRTREALKKFGEWAGWNAPELLAAARECAEAREQRDALAAALTHAKLSLRLAADSFTGAQATPKQWHAMKNVCSAESQINQLDPAAILAAHDAALIERIFDALDKRIERNVAIDGNLMVTSSELKELRERAREGKL